MDIFSAPFAIGSRPMCVWSPQLDSVNEEFLAGVDPELFIYQARLFHAAFDQTPDSDHRGKLHAAMSLRLAYGVATESLFAFLMATAQAPHCMFGWLTSYQPRELREVVQHMLDGKPVKAFAPFQTLTWKTMAAELLRPLESKQPERYAHLVTMFSNAWNTMAHAFVGDTTSREYNSLKHACRTQPKGFNLTVRTGHDQTPVLDVNTPLAHSFVYLKQKKGRQHHHDVKFATVALEPEQCIAGLTIAALSIHNAVAFVRSRSAADPSSLKLKVPDGDQLFAALRTYRSEVSAFQHGGVVKVDDSEYLSGEQILAAYDAAKEEV